MESKFFIAVSVINFSVVSCVFHTCISMFRNIYFENRQTNKVKIPNFFHCNKLVLFPTLLPTSAVKSTHVLVQVVYLHIVL